MAVRFLRCSRCGTTSIAGTPKCHVCMLMSGEATRETKHSSTSKNIKWNSKNCLRMSQGTREGTNTNDEIIDGSPNMSTITLNMDGVNTPVRRPSGIVNKNYADATLSNLC